MANPLDIQSIMKTAIARLAKQHSVLPDQIAVRLFLHPKTTLLSFQLLVNSSPISLPDREQGLMSFNQDILGQKIDLMNREAILNQLILPPAIDRFAQELGCKPVQVYVMICTLDNETCLPSLYLCKEEDVIRQIFIEDF